ncbi:MAG: NAD(P)/FAD-dependent oxidoreductase [Leptospiraceae bacterium]|nr:NAD(P)/FAD-dependent oxidoreductase [Leptospiraceae bacterium]
MIETDVLIVGGGPGGSSCAHELKKKGLQSIILDKTEFPRTKLCAGWITPGVLHSLGIGPEEYPRGIFTFNEIEGAYYSLKNTRPLRFKTTQYSIRRYEFDHWMLERSGAELHLHSVKEIEEGPDGFVVDDAFKGRYLVGAGGTHCPVYRALFADLNPRSQAYQVGALEQEFACNYSDSRCMLWFGENGLPGYSWYVPKEGGFLNVGIGGFSEHMRNARITLRQHWDLLTQKLEEMGLVQGHQWKPRGHTYFIREPVRHTRRGNAFLVGDAAGLATCDLAEGIGPAIESGIRTARIIAEGRKLDLSDIVRYSALGDGWKGRILSALDRKGTFFRDRIYARKFREKEERHLHAIGSGESTS